jgi:predicted outer membrane lipoprotein
LFFGLWSVESPLAFLEEEGKVGGLDAVEAAHVTLGLVPEILNSIDVVFLLAEAFAVVDALMLEVRDVEYIVRTERVRINDAVGHNVVVDDGLQRLALHILDDLGVHLSPAF